MWSFVGSHVHVIAKSLLIDTRWCRRLNSLPPTNGDVKFCGVTPPQSCNGVRPWVHLTKFKAVLVTALQKFLLMATMCQCMDTWSAFQHVHRCRSTLVDLRHLTAVLLIRLASWLNPSSRCHCSNQQPSVMRFKALCLCGTSSRHSLVRMTDFSRSAYQPMSAFPVGEENVVLSTQQTHPQG